MSHGQTRDRCDRVGPGRGAAPGAAVPPRGVDGGALAPEQDDVAGLANRRRKVVFVAAGADRGYRGGPGRAVVGRNPVLERRVVRVDVKQPERIVRCTDEGDAGGAEDCVDARPAVVGRIVGRGGDSRDVERAAGVACPDQGAVRGRDAGHGAVGLAARVPAPEAQAKVLTVVVAQDGLHVGSGAGALLGRKQGG